MSGKTIVFEFYPGCPQHEVNIPTIQMDEIHECQFYPLHRENGPPGFCLYCKQCVAGVPHGDPEDYYVD